MRTSRASAVAAGHFPDFPKRCDRSRVFPPTAPFAIIKKPQGRQVPGSSAYYVVNTQDAFELIG
jgi:hypothetical protein